VQDKQELTDLRKQIGYENDWIHKTTDRRN
jgi:hypothetical protein